MALGPLASIDRATLAYVAIALAFTLARGPRGGPASVLLPLALLLLGTVAVSVAPRARREGAKGAAFLMMSIFYVCYSIFFLFPVAGPRTLFPPAENAATAVPVAALTHRLVRAGSAWGTAFPSSHVAGALVGAACAWRGFRPLGAVLLPAAVLLSLATVYGQFYYAVDALAGSAIALAALTADRRAGYDSALP